MRVKQLIDLLGDADPDSNIRVSIEGERPLSLRTFAVCDGTVVLMATPGWDFSEINDNLATIAAVTSHPGTPESTVPEDEVGQARWETVYFANNGSWLCRVHSLKRPDCGACKLLAGPGWHRGLKEPGKLFCNCHANSTCGDAPPKPS